MMRADRPSLQIKRVIKASRSRVYAAWTDPAQLKQWFGPEDVRTNELVADARPGGEFRWELTSPEGEEMTVRGEYRELEPDKRIVFTWQFDDDETWRDSVSTVTVDLEDCDGGTALTLTHEQLPNEQSRDNHARGWESVLQELEKFCGK
jgi:uncharacterized protein YndB with AHSA1/START domain